MKTFIFDIKNFNNDQIIFKIPETRNNNIIIPIKYTNNKPLLFKTPKIYMPFKPNISNNQGGYLRLSFDNIKIDSDLKFFYEFINNIDNYLENKLLNSNIIKTSNIHFKKTIKKSEGYSDYFNLNFTNNEIKVYDSDLNLISITDVNGNFYAYFVIELIGFYYNKKIKQTKLIWNIIQFKLDKPRKIINECLFLDENIQIEKDKENEKDKEKEKEKEKIKDPLKKHPLLEKFFKMLTFGIPRIAIEHKMTLANISIKYLDYAPDTDINILPDILKQKLINNDDNILNDIIPIIHNKNNIIDIIKQNKLKISPKNKKNDIKKTLRVPSLLEIQQARQKLFEKSNIKNKDNL
jgi:hypothetical protein